MCPLQIKLPEGMTLNPVSRSRSRVSELRRKKNAAMKALGIKTGKAYRKYIKKKRRIASLERREVMTFETEYQLKEFREIQGEHFDSEGKVYAGLGNQHRLAEKMLKLINLLEAEIDRLTKEVKRQRQSSKNLSQ